MKWIRVALVAIGLATSASTQSRDVLGRIGVFGTDRGYVQLHGGRRYSLDLPAGYGNLLDATVTRSGRIVGVCWKASGAGPHLAYWHFDGTLDETVALPSQNSLTGLGVLSDGSIVVCGGTGNSLIRVREDGSFIEVLRHPNLRDSRMMAIDHEDTIFVRAKHWLTSIEMPSKVIRRLKPQPSPPGDLSAHALGGVWHPATKKFPQHVDLNAYSKTGVWFDATSAKGWEQPAMCSGPMGGEYVLTMLPNPTRWETRLQVGCCTPVERYPEPTPPTRLAEVGAPFLGTTYCTGKLNSDNCVPRIEAVGFPVANGRATPFRLRGSFIVPGELVRVFVSNRRNSIPWQGGYLCVRSPFAMTGLAVAEGNPALKCSGSVEIELNPTMAAAGLTPGGEVYLQLWQRDKAFGGIALSRGLAVTVLP